MPCGRCGALLIRGSAAVPTLRQIPIRSIKREAINMRVTLILLATILLMLPTVQAQTIDQCTPVLALTGRNDLLSIKEADRRAYFYKQLCKSSSSDASLTFRKAKATLGFSYASQEEFCQSERAASESHEMDFLKTSLVVEKALEAWSACVKLARAGLIITPHANPTRLTLAIERGGKGEGVVRSLYADAGTSCEGQLASFTGQKAQTLGKNINFPIPLNSTWNVICDRRAIPSTPQGSLAYPRTTITLDTTEGPFSLTLDPEPLAPSRWANEIRELITRLQADLVSFRRAQEGTVKECRVCFAAGVTGGGDAGQCPGPRDGCSAWSGTPGHSPVAVFDSDNRPGGCTYSVKLECR